jgi:hypothetical protein
MIMLTAVKPFAWADTVNFMGYRRVDTQRNGHEAKNPANRHSQG